MTPDHDVIIGNQHYHIIDKDIVCTEYAPDVFAHTRQIDGYDIGSIQQSLGPEIEANVQSIFKAGEGMGKSGSFFFFSHDGTFLIKTMTLGDFNAFKKLFRYYFEHINTQHDSLLARIYGVYSVKMDEQDPVYLILMGSSAMTTCIDGNPSQNYVKCKFDLKGSMVKRDVPGDIHKNTAMLKDKNIMRMKKEDQFLRFENDDINSIMNQMAKDVSLLSQFNLMDYSLLVVVEYNKEYVERYPNEFEHDKGQLVYPVRPSAEEKKKEKEKMFEFSNQIRKKQI